MSLETINKTPKPERESRENQSIFRNKVMRALVLGGYLGIIQACGGLKEADIEKIQHVTIAEMQKDPQKYLAMPMVKTEGYPHYEKTSGSQSDSLLARAVDNHRYQFFELHEGVEKTAVPPLKIFVDKGPPIGDNDLANVIAEIVSDLIATKYGVPGYNHKIRVVGKPHPGKDGGITLEILNTKDLSDINKTEGGNP